MKLLLVILVFSEYFASCQSEKTIKYISGKKWKLVQKDMYMSHNQYNFLFKPIQLKNGLRYPFLRWPNAIVYYQFDDSLRKLI